MDDLINSTRARLKVYKSERFGQAMWNISFSKYPKECEMIRDTEVDCFHDDSRVSYFIDTLLMLVECNKE